MKNYTKPVFVKVGMFIVVMSLFIGSSAVSAAVNVVPNANLETQSSGNQNIPDQWEKGTSDLGDVVTYTYPVTSAPVSDISSGNAAKIEATSFTSDKGAKWYFTPVPVTPGERYSFSDSYIATSNTDLVGVFCTDIYQNNCTYDTTHSVSATPTDTWEQATASFTVPIGKTYMTVFHRIQVAGSLTIDNYNLTLIPPPSPFASGFVTLTFDDGLLSQFNNALSVLNAGNAKATFFIPTHFISGFSIVNPSFENAPGGNPIDWTQSGGTSSSTFTLSSDSHNGGAWAGQVSDTVTTLSNAAWSFTPVTVIPDTIYSFKEYYKSTANSELVAKVTLDDNSTTITADVVDSGGATLGISVPLPASADYTQTQAYFYMPTNAKSVTILNKLTSAGTLTIDDVSLGREGYMTSDQVLSLQSAGNEIGGHTQTHPDLTTVTPTDLTNEISGGRQDLISNGITAPVSFAYPFGAYNTTIQDALTSAGYTSGRTVLPSGFNDLSTPKLSLFSQSIDANTTLDQVANWIAEAKANKSWLILTFHDIQNDITGTPYGTTPQILAGIISDVTSEGLPIKTVSEGVELMGNVTPPTDPVCTLPQVLENHICVTPVVTDPVCTLPQVLENHVCVTPVVTDPVCTLPQVLENHVCITPTRCAYNSDLLASDPLCVAPAMCQYNSNLLASDKDCVAPKTPTHHISSGSIPMSTQGSVLGAKTSCGIYIDKFLGMGLKDNDVEAVEKIQTFLNDNMSAGLVVDGFFGAMTNDALKAFQLAHADKVLEPWGLTAPTGIFYLTTQTAVNNIMCPALDLPIPVLTPIALNPLFPKK